LTTLENTLGDTPGKLATLQSNVTAVLAKAMGILNVSRLVAAPAAVAALPPSLKTLAAANLIPGIPLGSTTTLLDLTEGSLPANIDELGLGVAGTPFHMSVAATTGSGQILGNLLFNLSALTNSAVVV
jgi:hypothetical protein